MGFKQPTELPSPGAQLTFLGSSACLGLEQQTQEKVRILCALSNPSVIGLDARSKAVHTTSVSPMFLSLTLNT